MKRTVRRISAIFLSLALVMTMMLSNAVSVSALSYSGSSSYQSGKFYRALKNVQLTGNQRTDIVNVAKSQIGYQDIIYFKSSRNSNPTNHIGIVTGYSNKTVYTVEGNTSSATISTNGGAVAAKSYSISNTYIVYICKPNYSGTSIKTDNSQTGNSSSNSTTSTSGNYYPKCGSSYSSLVDALNSIGVDSSMTNRTKIAALNGITSYSGTADQNTKLLDLLKNG